MTDSAGGEKLNAPDYIPLHDIARLTELACAQALEPLPLLRNVDDAFYWCRKRLLPIAKAFPRECVHEAANRLHLCIEKSWRPKDSDWAKMLSDVLAPPEVPELASTQSIPREEPLRDTEAAVAEYLASRSANRILRYSRTRGTWMEWGGTHWKTCPEKVPLILQADIRRAVADGIECRGIEAKAAIRLESAAGMRGIASLLIAWPSVWLPTETDPPNMIACPRGVLELHTNEWLAHDPSRPITKVCPVDPKPGCPLWHLVEGHLRVCLGDTYTAVHRYLGSALIGRAADRRLLWLYGPHGGDGKSTLVRVLRYALGDHLAVIPAEVFSDGARGAHGHELASGLAGARLAVALEVGKRLDWPKLKGLSGGDAQVSKRLHGRAYTIPRPPLLMLVSNEKPEPPDNASAERIILAELRPPDEPDERLVQVLADGGPERDRLASACLSWLVAGCAAFVEHGIGPFQSVAAMPRGVELWWRESVASGEVVPKRGLTALCDVCGHFAKWAAEHGHDQLPEREVARFLKSVVPFKRTEAGSRYGLTIKGKG